MSVHPSHSCSIRPIIRLLALISKTTSSFMLDMRLDSPTWEENAAHVQLHADVPSNQNPLIVMARVHKATSISNSRLPSSPLSDSKGRSSFSVITCRHILSFDFRFFTQRILLRTSHFCELLHLPNSSALWLPRVVAHKFFKPSSVPGCCATSAVTYTFGLSMSVVV